MCTMKLIGLDMVWKCWVSFSNVVMLAKVEMKCSILMWIICLMHHAYIISPATHDPGILKRGGQFEEQFFLKPSQCSFSDHGLQYVWHRQLAMVPKYNESESHPAERENLGLRPLPPTSSAHFRQLFSGGKLPILVIVLVLVLYCIAFQLYLHYNTSCLKSSPHFAS